MGFDDEEDEDEERPVCDTPGCGRPIPVGGEGHPEICPTCLAAEAAQRKCLIVERPGDVTFRAFAEATNQRTTVDFGEALDATSKYGPEHWALMIQEEAGEVADALTHETVSHVGRELADVVAYAACLAIRAGLDMETLMRSRFDPNWCEEISLRDFAMFALHKITAGGPEHWALMMQIRAGRIAGAVIGALGMKRRKNHLTFEDVGREIAELLFCCACLAIRCGLDFQEIVRGKFNEVSDRVGSSVRL